ncbi:7468_t:CDS:1, partial [Funneliformis geosporum]
TPPWTDLTLNSETQKTINLFVGSTYNLMKDEDSFISNPNHGIYLTL